MGLCGGGKGAAPKAKPPKEAPGMVFKVVRWLTWAGTIGVAVGALAILDQRLRTVPFKYDGPNPRYQNQIARIEFCLLSDSNVTPKPARCQLATAAPALSLALSLLWVLVRGLARERAPGASPVPSIMATRLGEGAIAALGAGWWLAMGVVISLWTSQANAVREPSLPANDWRNTMSFLYWLNFLLFILLACTSALLLYLTRMRAGGRVPPAPPVAGSSGGAGVAPPPHTAVHVAAPPPVAAVPTH